MKKISKICLRLCLLVMAAVLVVPTVTVQAASSVTLSNTNGGSFEFEPGSVYSETDLLPSMKGLMPGDEVTEEITVTNTYSGNDYVKIYMQALGVSENNTDTPVDEMEEFLAQLEMKIYNGSELIYSASPNETAQLTQECILGSFRNGESTTLKVVLTVPQTLGNEYMDRQGAIKWLFRAEGFDDPEEPEDPEDPEEPVTPSDPQTPSKPAKPGRVQTPITRVLTGDSVRMIVYVVIIAAAVCALIVVAKKRKNKK